MDESKHGHILNRRHHGRLTTTELNCSLGDIINISAGGLVVLGKNASHYRFEIEIGSGDDHVIVLAERIWTAQAGLRKHLTGYRFIDPPDHLLSRIYRAVLPTSINRVIKGADRKATRLGSS